MSLATGVASAGALAKPDVSALSSILIDQVTGRVLWSKDPDRRLPMASTTKIMTLLIVLEHRRERLDDAFVVSDAAAGCTGIGLQPDDRITYRAAITGMIVRSATDCAIALACDVAGSEDEFVKLMNAKAAAWGLKRTHFTNSSGAPYEARHVTTARDLARLGRRAMRDDVVKSFTRVRDAVVTWESGSFTCHSGNGLLEYPWVDGVKAGFTPFAKYCLVTAGQPGLRPLISVTLHEPTRARNVADNLELLKYGSSLYRRRDLVRTGEVVIRRTLPDSGVLVGVSGGSLLSVVTRKAAVVERRVVLARSFGTAPAPETYVGTATYRADGVVLGTVDLYAFRPPMGPGSVPEGAPMLTRIPGQD